MLALVSSAWFFPGGPRMHIHAAQPLFAWACLDDCPTLSTLRDFLAAAHDQRPFARRRAARGHGHNGYPVELLWRVVLLTIDLRHTSFDACLAEPHRNPAPVPPAGPHGRAADPQRLERV